MEYLIELFIKQSGITPENYSHELFETQLNIFIDKYSKNMIKEIDSISGNHFTSELINIRKFVDRNKSRWKDLFQTFQILHSCCSDVIIEWKQLNLNKSKNDELLHNLLLELHAKALRHSKEIIYLCEGGFPDAAFSIWRSLHEICCISLFIAKHGEVCALQFIEHSILDEIKHFEIYEIYKERLKISVDYDSKKHQFLKKQISEKYPTDFKVPYGWAKKFLSNVNKPSFFAIEKEISLDHYRFFYKAASHNIHSSFLNLHENLGTKEATENILLIGQSNSGMALPLSCTTLSLTLTTLNILNLNPTLQNTIAISIISHYSSQIETIILNLKDAPYHHL